MPKGKTKKPRKIELEADYEGNHVWKFPVEGTKEYITVTTVGGSPDDIFLGKTFSKTAVWNVYIRSVKATHKEIRKEIAAFYKLPINKMFGIKP